MNDGEKRYTKRSSIVDRKRKESKRGSVCTNMRRERKERDRNIEGGDVMNLKTVRNSRTWGAKKTQLTAREENKGEM